MTLEGKYEMGFSLHYSINGLFLSFYILLLACTITIRVFISSTVNFRKFHENFIFANCI